MTDYLMLAVACFCIIMIPCTIWIYGHAQNDESNPTNITGDNDDKSVVVILHVTCYNTTKLEGDEEHETSYYRAVFNSSQGEGHFVSINSTDSVRCNVNIGTDFW